MRHAAGELADRLHLLRLAQRVLDARLVRPSARAARLSPRQPCAAAPRPPARALRAATRTSYWRCRARTAACSVLVSVIGWTGRSSSETLPSARHQLLRATSATRRILAVAGQHDERQVGPRRLAPRPSPASGARSRPNSASSATNSAAAPACQRLDQASQAVADVRPRARPCAAARPRPCRRVRSAPGSGRGRRRCQASLVIAQIEQRRAVAGIGRRAGEDAAEIGERRAERDAVARSAGTRGSCARGRRCAS